MCFDERKRVSLSNEIWDVLLDFVLRAIEGTNKKKDDHFILPV